MSRFPETETSPDLSRLAGRVLMADLRGPCLSTEEADCLCQLGVRALVLFSRNLHSAAQTRQLVANLRAALGEDLLLAIDQEGGAVTRTPFLPTPPSAMALGALDEAGTAQAVGAAVGRGLASLGINWNFAPVVDLNSNPHNPVIAERAFGAHALSTVRLARAWMDGHLAQGVAVCLKHFPGHGDTQLDSHWTLPCVEKSREDLERQELAPFRVLTAPPQPGIALMAAHILFPAFDAEYPASLSFPLLGKLLRKDWNYDGVLVSDALNMKAIDTHWGQAQGARLALQAQSDLAMVLGARLDGSIPEAARDDAITFYRPLYAAHAAIRGALHTGQLPVAQLQRSSARLDAQARAFPAQPQEYHAAHQAADAALFREVWRRALTFLPSTGNAPAGGRFCEGAFPYKSLPPRPGIPPKGIRLVMPREGMRDGIAERSRIQPLIDRLAARGPFERVVYDDPRQLDWQTLPHDGTFTLLASYTRARLGAHEQANWRPDLHLVLWNPYAADDLPVPALVTYGWSDAALEAAADWLSGS